MPRVTVYIPDDLKTRMDEVGDGLNWSSITQRAIREAIATHSIVRKQSTMTDVIERLRASKQRADEASLASGEDCGGNWARAEAEYDELKRVCGAIHNDHIDLRDLQQLIDPQDTLDQQSWEAFWETHGDGDLSDLFVKGFVIGANNVFEEVKHQL